MIPLMITEKQANEMIESDTPISRRTFIFIENGQWVAADNRQSEWQEKKFSTIKSCMNWLKGKTTI